MATSDKSRFKEISIHAPTRGATWINNIFVSVYIISIHAPTRGATKIIEGIIDGIKDFNPRSHKGSDYF